MSFILRIAARRNVVIIKGSLARMLHTQISVSFCENRILNKHNHTQIKFSVVEFYTNKIL
jgi:hypothetical protein